MNDYFCVLPFYGAEYTITHKTPCCLLPNNTNIEQLRKDMLSGTKPTACNKCWHLEDQGKTSDRQLKNLAYDFYADRDIRLVKEDCQTGNFSEQIVKLYTSKICNSTCVTCGPNFSSAWATLKKIPIEYSVLPDDLLDKINYTNLKILSFVGGEPLYEKKNFKILEKLIDVGNTNCFISLVTNGSVNISNYQLDILKQFKNLNFCLSIDGVGPVFEYLRYPLKWNTLLDNIELYKQLGIQLSVSYTISNLNILYFKETTDWFKAQGLEYNYNLVSFPKSYSPNSLPLNIKDQIDAKNLLLPHSTQDDTNFKLFLKDIRKQDILKGISIEDYLPKLVDLFT